MSRRPEHVLLKIRPSLPDADDPSAMRTPLMMESVLSSLHSLKGVSGQVSLEIGLHDGKISMFARSARRAAALVESQFYGQYPDAEIEIDDVDIFHATEKEVVHSCDLVLTDPEVFPIKRYPQFTETTTRQTVDPIAGITSALVRYPAPGMRAHVSIILTPVRGGHYRHKALKFIPLLTKGMPKHFPRYAKLFTKVHMSHGLKRILLLPLDGLMGGFRTWFMRMPQYSVLTGELVRDGDDENEHAAMRSHDREDQVTAAADKINRLLFHANVRVSVIAPKSKGEEAEAKVEEIAASFRQFALPNCNGFQAGPTRAFAQIPQGFREHPYVLSVEEVATLWHMPNILVKTPNFDWVLSRKLEPPIDLPIVSDEDDSEGSEEITAIGEAIFRGERRKFGIRPDDRRRHMYIIGKTGMGKSTLLENMIFSDIHMGRGVAVIDPHGDLIEACLKFIPASRTNDVILFDPADKEHPVAFNMLSVDSDDQRALVVSGLMSVFKKLWPEAFSGRMEYILRNTLLALTEAKGNSMLGIMRMFSDPAYRIKTLEHVEDHVVKSFWEDEFTSWSEKYQTEALAAIQNKIGQLLSTPLIRNIIGQVTTKLDIRHAMDTGKIILMNLSKGKLGEDNSAFLGSMFVTKFQLDAMSRADVPEKQRRDFYLYVDEFQNFATESFATILSEARKYRLNLTMANQYIGQLLLGEKGNTALKDAVFGNVGSMVTFQVGSDDAEPLSEQFEEMVLPKDILSLPKYHAYVRLMVKGVPSKPFSVQMLPPPVFTQDEGRMEKVKKMSRERYSEERKIVESKIGKWVASGRESRVTAKSSEKMKEKTEEEMKKAKAKKMTLEQYRAWRDREMWLNDFNALRKREFLGEKLGEADAKMMAELEKKLVATGGVPPPSKTLLDAAEKAKKAKGKEGGEGK